MKSPKFQFIEKDISTLFSEQNIKSTWNGLKKQIRSQITLDLIEYKDYDLNIKTICRELNQAISLSKYQTKKTNLYLVEKSRGLCRQMTMVHPIDLLVLEILSKTIYKSIKDSSDSKGAFFEPDDGNLKEKFKSLESGYGSFASWKKFQIATFDFVDENKFIVIADVANFYDFINFRHLRNIIASMDKIKESYLDLIIYVLNNLSWTPDYMPRSEVGMPQIESSAPRVLANAMLFEVDRVAESHSLSNYARFMDDIDLGVDTIGEAKIAIRDIDLTLQSRQLRLNSSKTRILTQEQAYDHFCIKENRKLGIFERFIEKHVESDEKLKWISNKLKTLYLKWWDGDTTGNPNPNSRFRTGNGSKILKWTYRLIRESGGEIPSADLLWVVKNEPGVRESAFRYLMFSNTIDNDSSILLNWFNSNWFVDDASLIYYTNFLIHSRFANTKEINLGIKQLISKFIQNKNVGMYCSILVSAKFLKTVEILEILGQNINRIKGDFWLERAFGGVAPRFLNDSSNLGFYIEHLRHIDSENADSVFNFHKRLSTDVSFSNKFLTYMKAENYTFPQKIIFSKVLMILSTKKNQSFSKNYKILLGLHKSLNEDPFFKGMGF